jgi:hypothetical protein
MPGLDQDKPGHDDNVKQMIDFANQHPETGDPSKAM